MCIHSAIDGRWKGGFPEAGEEGRWKGGTDSYCRTLGVILFLLLLSSQHEGIDRQPCR